VVAALPSHRVRSGELRGTINDIDAGYTLYASAFATVRGRPAQALFAASAAGLLSGEMA